MADFEAFPKIPRMNRLMTVTEKIDGTNGAVIVEDRDGELVVSAQSRNRLITPEQDNFGFARWVHEHAAELGTTLGEGRHFGEWWGSGIQRGYGLTKGDKRFSLFNTARWGDGALDESAVPGLGVVPVLELDIPFDTTTVRWHIADLMTFGSKAAPGFMDPEGVIVWHHAARSMMKVTCKGDEQPKGANA